MFVVSVDACVSRDIEEEAELARTFVLHQTPLGERKPQQIN